MAAHVQGCRAMLRNSFEGKIPRLFVPGPGSYSESFMALFHSAGDPTKRAPQKNFSKPNGISFF